MERDREYTEFLYCLKKNIEKKEGGAIDYRKLAEKTGVKKSTLFGILKEGRDAHGSNLVKLIRYSECHIHCNKGERVHRFF